MRTDPKIIEERLSRILFKHLDFYFQEVEEMIQREMADLVETGDTDDYCEDDEYTEIRQYCQERGWCA